MPAAKVNGSVPQMHVPGITRKPPRLFVGNTENRKRLKLLVVIQYRRPAIVFHLTPSAYAGQPAIKAYIDPKTHAARKGSSAEQYGDSLRSIMLQQVLPNLRGDPLVLWHDRDPCHKAALTGKVLQELGLQQALLPARSPDLDPLDYGVFGPAKRQFERDRCAGRMGWDAACARLVARLESKANYDAVMDELPLRLQACLDAEGHHLEDALAAIKKKTPSGQGCCKRARRG